jgi:uncharacterized membrane protein YgcG
MTFFGINVLLLIVACFIGLFFVASSKRRLALFLALFVSFVGYNTYSSHKDVLGIPVNMTWEELPSKITINFFRIDGDSAILLWLAPDQLVRLPYNPDAEDALEGERESMGEGIPSTFEGGGGEGEQGDGEGEGQGGEGNGEGEAGEGEPGAGGWNYHLLGRGGVAVPGSLPPK